MFLPTEDVYQDKYGEHYYCPITGRLLTRFGTREKCTVWGGASLKNPSGSKRLKYSDAAYEFGAAQCWTNEEVKPYFKKVMCKVKKDLR